MLDEKREAVLNLIIRECNDRYKIFETSDFLEIDGTEECIKYLALNDYISLKYSGNGEYLIAPLQKGKEYFSLKENNLIFRAVICKKVAQYALLGAVVGSFFAFVLCWGISCVT